jgi:hypothetical protein
MEITMEGYLDLMEKEMELLKKARENYDLSELNYDSAYWLGLQEYMAGPDAKATLADKATKANPKVQEVKKMMQECDRQVSASINSIKLLQNRYEGCKLHEKLVNTAING